MLFCHIIALDEAFGLLNSKVLILCIGELKPTLQKFNAEYFSFVGKFK